MTYYAMHKSCVQAQLLGHRVALYLLHFQWTVDKMGTWLDTRGLQADRHQHLCSAAGEEQSRSKAPSKISHTGNFTSLLTKSCYRGEAHIIACYIVTHVYQFLSAWQLNNAPAANKVYSLRECFCIWTKHNLCMCWSRVILYQIWYHIRVVLNSYPYPFLCTEMQCCGLGILELTCENENL